MTWECGCGVVNRDSKVKCRACRTPQGMVWTPHGFKSADDPVDLSDAPRRKQAYGYGWFCVIGGGVIFLLAAGTGASLKSAQTRAWYVRAAGDTMIAVTQAIKYAQDKGVYPTSINALREGEIVYCACRDKDPWGNDYVLSPLLTEGRTPKEGDNVYVYSRGPIGKGVYPQPFTSDTGEDGSIGYSSVDGCFAGAGPPRVC